LDQSVIARVVRVAPGRFAPGHLGELTQQVPFEMVDAVLAQTCRVQSRVRDLPARVVVCLLLAGCLFAELGYVQVWHRLTAGLDGLPTAPDCGRADPGAAPAGGCAAADAVRPAARPGRSARRHGRGALAGTAGLRH
jgi:Insertion element 4 transposase N-terminal